MTINIGAINFTVDANTAGLRKAVAEMDKFRRVVDQTAKSQAQGASRTATELSRQESAMKRAFQQALNLQQAMRAASAPPQMIAQASNAFVRLQKEMTSGTLTSIEFARAMDAFAGRLGRANRNLRDFKTQQATQQTGRFNEILRDIQSASVLAVGPLSGLGSRINAVGAIAQRSNGALVAMAIGVASLTAGLYFSVSGAINASRAYERINATLTTVTGSSHYAAAQFKEIEVLSRRLGQPVQTAAEQFAQLSAATKFAGVSGKDTKAVFEGLLTAASALNLNNMQLENSVRAVVQMFSKGKVQAEELRGQLGEQMPGAFQLFARSIGVSTNALDSMLKKGQIGTEEIIKFGKALTVAFGPGAAAAANTTQAKLNNLSTAVFALGRSVDEAFGVLDAFKGGLEALTNTVDWAAKHMRDLQAAAVALAAGLAILFAPSILAGATKLASSLGALFGAGAAAGAAGAASGLGRLLPILGRLGIVGGVAAGTFYVMQRVLDKSVDSYKEAADAAEEFVKMTSNIGAGADAKNHIVELLDAQIKKTREAINTNEDYLNQARALGSSSFTEKYGLMAGMEISDKAAKAPETLKRLNAELTNLIRLKTEANKVPLLEMDKGQASASTKAQSVIERIKDIAATAGRIADLKTKSTYMDITEGMISMTKAGIEAERMLNNLGAEDLPFVDKALAELGLSGDTTEKKLATLILTSQGLEDWMAKLGKQIKNTAKSAEHLTRIGTEMALLNERTAMTIKGPQALEQYDRDKERMRTLVRVRAELAKTNTTMEQRNLILKVYEQELIAAQNAEQFAITASRDLAEAITSSLGDALLRTKSLKEAVLDLGKAFQRIALEQGVLKPFQHILEGMFESGGMNKYFGSSFMNQLSNGGSNGGFFSGFLSKIGGLFSFGGGGGGGGGFDFGLGGSSLGGSFSSGLHFASGGVVPGKGAKTATVHGGEGVFTPEQMKALSQGKGGGGNGVTINVAMQGVQGDVQATQRRDSNGGIIVDMVIQALNIMGSDGRLERALQPIGATRVPSAR